MDKKELRELLKSGRRSLTAAEIEEKSAAVCERLLPLLRGAVCVMTYLSAFKEVCVDGLTAELIKSGATVAVPVTDPDTSEITPSLLTYLDDVEYGAYGIREPSVISEIPKHKINAVIIPGVGFSKSGARLGFGKGCYDRFLEDFEGLKIGVCYELQLTDELTAEEHDIPMDMVITERNTYVI